MRRRVVRVGGALLLLAGLLVLLVPYRVTAGYLESGGRTTRDLRWCGPFVLDGVGNANTDGWKQECWRQDWARIAIGPGLLLGGLVVVASAHGLRQRPT